MPKKRKHRGKHQPQMPPRPRPAAGEVLPALDLNYLNAATIITPEWTTAEFIIAGCGGIGGYVVQHVGRLMYVLYRLGKMAHMKLIDPKVVSELNPGRQLFCDAEIGKPKAAALAERYGFAWGLNTSYHVGEFDEKLRMPSADVTFIIGCVDGAAGRRAMHEALSSNEAGGPPRIWWLDCGNAHDTGQVVLGCMADSTEMRGAFPNKEVCVRLPSPAIQYPELLRERREELAGTDMTCEEMLVANQQSLNVNADIAVKASNMLTRLLVTYDLNYFACQINTAACTTLPTYATPEEVARASKKPVSFITSGMKAEEAEEERTAVAV